MSADLTAAGGRAAQGCDESVPNAHESDQDNVQRPSLPTDTLAKALAGNGQAWDCIVNEYTGLLWWIARSYRLDDATAADVVQTVWLQLLRFGDRIRNPAALPGWLATTARREATRRVSNRDVPSEWIDDRADHTLPASDERLIDEETTGVVLAAFSLLSAQEQRLLNLLCEDPPKSYAEIAALLGKSPGYIGPSRQRALQKLRALANQMGLS